MSQNQYKGHYFIIFIKTGFQSATLAKVCGDD